MAEIIAWKKHLSYRDIVSKNELLKDIKTNLISLLNDYKGRGIENEDFYISEVQKMFMGGVVPSRIDWKIMINVLRELSEVKEQGKMYENFIEDVSDSLGVSDLEKVRSFIEYIATLPPDAPSVSVTFDKFEHHQVYGVMTTFDKSIQVPQKTNRGTVHWSVREPEGISNARITLYDANAEDIKEYLIEVIGIRKRETFRIEASKLLPSRRTQINIPFNWREWFGSDPRQIVFQIELTSIDKRGNTGTTTVREVLPQDNKVPLGFEKFEVQYRPTEAQNWQTPYGLNRSSLVRGYERSFGSFDLLDLDGNHKFRVRGYDPGTGWTNWIESPNYWMRFIGDPPGRPYPVLENTTLNSATISWNPVPDVDYYNVYIGTNKRDLRVIRTNQSLRVTFSGLSQGTTYEFYVEAVNEWYSTSNYVSGLTKSLPGTPYPRISNSSLNQITVNWNAVTDVSYYNVYIGSSRQNETRVYPSSSLSTTFRNLNENTSHTFYVEAVNAYGQRTGQTTGRTRPSPGTPNPKITSSTAYETTISWSPTSNTDYYHAYIWSNKQDLRIIRTNQSLSTTFRGLSEGTNYQFYVEAFNEWNSARNYVSGTTKSLPGTPSPRIESATLDTITVAWSSVSNTDYYNVYIGTSRRDEKRIFSGSSLNATFRNLNENSSYTFYVEAVNNQGQRTGQVIGRTQQNPGKPAPWVSDISLNAITVSWRAVSNVSHYNVYVGSSRQQETRVFANNPLNVTFRNLSEDTSYTFYVEAVNHYGEQVGQVTGRTQQRPGIPTPRISRTTLDTISITWSAVQNVTHYNVYMGLNRQQETRVMSGGSLNVTFRDLSENKDYTFYVEAVNPQATERGQVTGRTEQRPGMPFPRVTNITETQATISWSQTPNTDYYHVYISTSKRDLRVVFPYNTLSATFNGLNPGENYTFYVEAINQWDSTRGSVSGTTLASLGTVRAYFISSTLHAVSIGWNEVENALKYRIYVDYPGNREVVVNKDVLGQTISKLNEDTTYNFYIEAIGERGSEIGSVSGTTKASPGKPVPLTKDVKETEVTVYWKKTSNTDYYNSYIWMGRNDLRRIENVSSPSTTFTGLNPGSEYNFYVEAVNKYATSTSAVTQRTIKPKPLPGKPAPVISEKGTTTLTMTWDATAHTDYYWAYIWTANKTYEQKVKIMANKTRKAHFTGLKANTKYSLYVESVNDEGMVYGGVSGTTNKIVIKDKTYSGGNHQRFNGQRYYNTTKGYRTPSGIFNVIANNHPNWEPIYTRSQDSHYQGHWREIYGTGYAWRGGGSSRYQAYDGQSHGNNATFIMVPYSKMRTDLKGKKITKVEITLQRSGSINGWKDKGLPLYLYNHNSDLQPGDPLAIYDWNREKVTRSNNPILANVNFKRGAKRTIQGPSTVKMVENIVNGHMKGFAFIRYYGSTFNSTAVGRAEEDYMLFIPSQFSVKVFYEDN